MKFASFIRQWENLTEDKQELEHTIMKSGVPNAHRVLSKMEDGPPDAPIYYQEIYFRLQGVVMDVRLGGIKRFSS